MGSDGASEDDGRSDRMDQVGFERTSWMEGLVLRWRAGTVFRMAPRRSARRQ